MSAEAATEIAALKRRVAALEKLVAELETSLAWARNPSQVRRDEGHADSCINVTHPRALFPCDCGAMDRAKMGALRSSGEADTTGGNDNG